MRPAKRLHLLLRLRLLVCERRVVDGISLAALPDQFDDRTSLDRIEEALALIHRYDPRRYRRLQRDIGLIGIWLLPGYLGFFDDKAQSIAIDRRFVMCIETTPAMIASVIVHEACHARLWSLGFDDQESRRSRIEVLCQRQELLFAKKLNDHALVNWTSAWDANAAMSDRQLAEIQIAGGVDVLRHLKAPEVVIRTVVALRRWRDAARRLGRAL
jgi:hypothetical protein